MTDFWKDKPRLGAQLAEVSALMDSTIRDLAFPLAKEVAALVDSRGKMLRPAFLLIGAGFGKKAEHSRVLSLAAAIEILHVSTLIHDDILDDAELRRGRPTLHTTLTTKDAVLAGDWLFSRCFLLAAESSGPESARALSRVIAAICSSEIRQDLDKWSYSTSVRAYLRKIAGKTAALFALALQVGADEAKAPRLQAQGLRRAGYDIGMAFQIMDDVLDFESSSDVMRKPVGKDLAEGLCTLPLIMALRRDEAGVRHLLSRLRPDGATVDPSVVTALLERCAELGAIEGARVEVRRFTERAKAEIARLPRCEARDDLSSLAERLLSRSY
jgi:heptaprenyl diphosphate synthase